MSKCLIPRRVIGKKDQGKKEHGKKGQFTIFENYI